MEKTPQNQKLGKGHKLTTDLLQNATNYFVYIFGIYMEEAFVPRTYHGIRVYEPKHSSLRTYLDGVFELYYKMLKEGCLKLLVLQVFDISEKDYLFPIQINDLSKCSEFSFENHPDSLEVIKAGTLLRNMLDKISEFKRSIGARKFSRFEVMVQTNGSEYINNSLFNEIQQNLQIIEIKQNTRKEREEDGDMFLEASLNQIYQYQISC